jgi:hypothetical protein
MGQAQYCAQADSGNGVELPLQWKLVEFRGLGRDRGCCRHIADITDMLQTCCRHCRHIADILQTLQTYCGGTCGGSCGRSWWKMVGVCKVSRECPVTLVKPYDLVVKRLTLRLSRF